MPLPSLLVLYINCSVTFTFIVLIVVYYLFPSYPLTLKSTRDMIEKVNITDANVVELIREKLPAATEANKGLMQANGFEQGKNILNEEYDSKISAGVYSSTDNLNNMGTGILLALRGFQYTAHLYITNSARIYIKTIRSNGEVLKDWTLINNTKT
mgnify:CR=1 FL=1